jgi:hypothetical protein
MEFFEVVHPSGDGLCSDNACPCPQVPIPRGTGYLYISQSLVDFRQDARTADEAFIKLQRLAEQEAKSLGTHGYIRIAAPGTSNPILMCEQGARLRGIDLEVAATDAKYWWETGLAPLRATPLTKKT